MAASSNAQPVAASSEEPNRRGEIVRASGRLFREKGYAATTIRDIASAVGMGSGSPFYHFKTKHDMLRAVALEGIDRIYGAVKQVVDEAADKAAETVFLSMLKAHLGQLLGDEGQDYAAVLLHESRHLAPAALADVVQLKDRYEQLWTDILGQLKAEGRIGNDGRIARLFLMGAMNWTTLWFRPDGPLSADQISEQLADWVLCAR